MTWIWMALSSALLLGFYDVAKKQALRRNGVLWVIFSISLISTLFLSPFLSFGQPLNEYLLLVPKAVFVSICWVTGLAAMKTLPLTIVSTIKASRPVFVVVFSIILFAERLNAWQWAGVLVGFLSLFMLSRSSRVEGVYFSRNKGILYMVVSVATGVASALYDKYCVRMLDPLFVQGWSNFFITLFLGIWLAVKSIADGPGREKFTWDWMILLSAVLIVGADALYFFALKQDGSLLSVIALLRRFSAVVTFAMGALCFGEKNLKAKSLDLAVLMLGMVLLVYGSSLG